jgi:histidine triad (HIT) family protein
MTTRVAAHGENQMDGCMICDELADADTPFVFVDDAVAVFAAALQPVRNHGCVLVVTVAHVDTLYELSDEWCGVVMRRLRDVARAVQIAAGADGTTIRQNNHPPGQDVAHLHFHVAPRFHGDSYWAASGSQVDHGLRVEQARRIAEVLDVR